MEFHCQAMPAVPQPSVVRLVSGGHGTEPHRLDLGMIANQRSHPQRTEVSRIGGVVRQKPRTVVELHEPGQGHLLQIAGTLDLLCFQFSRRQRREASPPGLR